MTRTHALAVALVAALPAMAGAGEVRPQATLTLEGARRATSAVTALAQQKGVGSTVAVVDAGGHVLALERVDGTFAASGQISIGKARTAALFLKPTRVFEDVIGKGRTAMVALPDFTPLKGGVPISVDGQVVGAVGVSGASSADQDDEFATAGAAAAGIGPSLVSLGAADVAAAFAKGMPLRETPDYKIHASRRTGPGQVEIHERETDILYVQSGTATVVTGGTVIGGAPSADDHTEIRGARTEGGTVHKIGPGDVMVIPAGVPHWFSEVPGPLTYYVVKVIR